MISQKAATKSYMTTIIAIQNTSIFSNSLTLFPQANHFLQTNLFSAMSFMSNILSLFLQTTHFKKLWKLSISEVDDTFCFNYY